MDAREAAASLVREEPGGLGDDGEEVREEPGGLGDGGEEDPDSDAALDVMLSFVCPLLRGVSRILFARVAFGCFRMCCALLPLALRVVQA